MRLASFGPGLALVLGLATSATNAAPPGSGSVPERSGRVPTIYHKSRSFRIPFNVDPAERARLKEVQLWVSDDKGISWKPNTVTTPDRPSFTFRASRDDEYWFAVRTLDTQGRLYPSDDDQVEPSMKVVVDTKPPSLILEPDGRRGSVASVRWEVHDENLAPASLVIEYQAEGADTWRKVTITSARLIGSERWDAGTADPLRVRAQIEDRAGNVAEATTALPEGTPTNPNLAARGDDGDAFAQPPPLVADSGFPIPEREVRGGLPDVQEVFPPSRTTPIKASNRNQAAAAAAAAPAAAPAQTPAPPAFESESDTFQEAPAAESMRPAPREPAPQPNRTLLVGTTQFPLQYEVEDAGPDGPSSVEIYVSRNSGRTWTLAGEDQDKKSPIQVDLPGEGTYGLCLVARSASGLGDLPPGPGAPPQLWVEVDTTPPSLIMVSRPAVGIGRDAGKVMIKWKAADFHLGPRPVTLFWRADKPGDEWKEIAPPVENTGFYIWNVPPDVPPRIHIRIEVADTIGNVSTVETGDTGPVIVDRSRPKGRIIGLDPSARTGGAGNGSLR